MPLFHYQALSDAGKKIKGVIDADSYDLAKERLVRDQVMVIKLFAIQKKREIVLGSSLLLAFTRELSQLLRAGLPLYEALLTIEEKYRRHRVHSLFLDLCDQLKSGQLLSFALKNYASSFDSIYISMVQAGEKSGSLSWVFSQLHTLIEKKQKLKKQLLSAMAYPLFLGGFCFLMILGLLLFVIPSMRELFEERHLHPLTQIVLATSRFLESYFLPLALGLTTLIVGVVYFLRQPQGKALFRRGLQKVPLIKTILTQAALIRFFRSCSILLFGGVPLMSALSIARKVMQHPFLEEAVENAEKKIVEGKALSAELKHSPYMPALVVRMVAIAEETGKFPEMFQSLSDIYDDQLERSLAQVTTFLQPVLLLILGGIVGIAILSILLPLTDVSSFISS